MAYNYKGPHKYLNLWIKFSPYLMTKNLVTNETSGTVSS